MLELPQETRDQFYDIKYSSITNALKAMFKLKDFEEAASVFLQYSPENDTNIKYLRVGCEILLAKSKVDIFEQEMKRIEDRYKNKNRVYFEEFRERVYDFFAPKFASKRSVEDLQMQRNMQKLWNEESQRKYEEQ